MPTSEELIEKMLGTAEMVILSERLKDQEDQKLKDVWNPFYVWIPNKRLREMVTLIVKSFYEDKKKMFMRI